MTNATRMNMANWTKMVVSENGGGTGNITLGAVNGYPAIADTLGTSKCFHYVFRAVNNTPIEAGVGYMIDAVTLRRDDVYAKIVDGVYSAGEGLTGANIPVGVFLYTADTKEMLMDLVREGLEVNYGNVASALTISLNNHSIRANLTANTTFTVDVNSLPPPGVHHEVYLKLTSANHPSNSPSTGFDVTLDGTDFFMGNAPCPSIQLQGDGKETLLRLTNIGGGQDYRVENLSKFNTVRDLGVVSGLVTLDIRHPFNVAEMTGSDTTVTINAVSPEVGVEEPAHFTFVNNGSVTKTVSFNTNILSIAGSTIAQVTLPIGYKIDFDIRRNPLNSAISYEAKVGDVNYNQTASGLATTWNPSDTNASAILSNNNKTFTIPIQTSGSTPVTPASRVSRVFGGKISGKIRGAIILNQIPVVAPAISTLAQANLAFGIASAGHPLTSTIGGTAFSYSYFYSHADTTSSQGTNNDVRSSGKMFNGVFTSGFPNIANNDVLGVLVDFDAKKIWFTRNETVIGASYSDVTAGLNPAYSNIVNTIMYLAVSAGANTSGNTVALPVITIIDEVQDPYYLTFSALGFADYWNA